MQIIKQDAELYVDNRVMRTYVAEPKEAGQYPGILLYSEIFQLTGPIKRSVERLAGHGFVVAAPEIYHRIEKPGVVIPYDDIGRIWGSDDARQTSVAEFDADCRAVLDFLAGHKKVAQGKLGTMGFCIGGHLAFRAALLPEIKAAVCAYPTGLHNGKLGADADAGTLNRVSEIRGEILVVFGETDPHVPQDARKIIADKLNEAGIKHRVQNYPGEHAFMRDEGPRYDSEGADAVWAETVSTFKRVFAK